MREGFGLRLRLLALPAAMLCAGVPAQTVPGPAQPTNGRQYGSPAPSDPTILFGSRPFDDPRNPFNRKILHQRAEARKLERQKSMVDSAKRLVELTEQFQKDAHAGPLTAEDAKRLDEITKLARVVKERMAGN